MRFHYILIDLDGKSNVSLSSGGQSLNSWNLRILGLIMTVFWRTLMERLLVFFFKIMRMNF